MLPTDVLVKGSLSTPDFVACASDRFALRLGFRFVIRQSARERREQWVAADVEAAARLSCDSGGSQCATGWA